VKKTYQAIEKRPGVWEKKTRWQFSTDEIVSGVILTVIVGWFVVKLVSGL
jgi:hypothetical protein